MQACFADIEQTQEHYLRHALVLQPFFKKDSCFPYKRSKPHAWSLTLWTGQVMIFPPPNYLSSEITSLWFLRLLLLWKYHLAPKAMVRKLHWITARECHGQDISENHHCLVQRSVFRRFHCRWFPSKLIPDAMKCRWNQAGSNIRCIAPQASWMWNSHWRADAPPRNSPSSWVEVQKFANLWYISSLLTGNPAKNSWNSLSMPSQ